MIIPYTRAISKWTNAKMESISTAEKLKRATLPPDRAATSPDSASAYWKMRADRMAECSSRIIYNYCVECGSMHIARTNLCRDRLCPVCSWRLALQRSGEMMSALSHIAADGRKLNAAMFTVTISNVPIEGLSDALSAILAAWSRLRKRAVWNKWVDGYARSLEITKGKEGYHPHMHIFIIWREGYKKHISQRELCDLWRASLRVDYTPVCDIRTAYNRGSAADPCSDEWSKLISAAVEATKYSLSGKVTHGISDPNELAALALAVRGRRLLAYGGIIAEARAALNFSDDDTAADVGDMTIECPKCGGAMVSLAYEWCTGGYLLGLLPS
ncbi:MAG: protein rep, partial [Clostridia bacterium]|nr:protein rep [Clostridia bacterium]